MWDAPPKCQDTLDEQKPKENEMSHTFELGLKVTPNLGLNTEQYHDRLTTSLHQAVVKNVGTDVEQTSVPGSRLIDGPGPHLAGLSHLAFADHRHMILDPDTVWLTIEKGLAIHITENAEELRQQFVKFDGKKTIEIQRNNFIKGGVNDWESCFDEFSEKIGEEIGENKRELIVGNFSTTNKLQRVTSEIMLMEAMSKYFSYACSTACAIPLVTLEGTVEDWENIRDRTRALSEFGLSWWTDELLPVLDQLVLTAKGKPDLDFWVSWYKEGGGSGGPFIDGHVTKFYPYLKIRNTYRRADLNASKTLNQFVRGYSQVPFIWDYYGTKYPMEFLGGITGVTQDSTGAIRCSFGWAVRDSSVLLLDYAWEKLTKDLVVYHPNGQKGTLKQAYDKQRDDGSHEIMAADIEWENGLAIDFGPSIDQGPQKLSAYYLQGLYVKEPASGAPIT